MLNVAVKAARAAGAIINRAALDVEAVRISQKQVNDFVTEVDHASEAAIIETLLTAYPHHAIWAEESGKTHGAQGSDFVWIIDPLDGTTNFIHGFPIYCVSIALAVKGKVEQAVIYDPSRNDLFTATKGRGAGFTDGFFETGLSPWDVAAGSLLVQEAGGLIGNFSGDSDFMEQKECVAGNPKIYGQLVAILGKYSKFASAGDKAAVRQNTLNLTALEPRAGAEVSDNP
ncbi:MAG: suhB [Ramlibacter sp.]|nr:suhB [Ramlibacter sp.]